MGLFGALIYVALVLRLVGKTFPKRALNMKKATLAEGLVVIYHINVVQFLIGELRTDHQRPDVRVFYMWFLFGLLALAYYLRQRERRDAPKVALPGSTGVGR